MAGIGFALSIKLQKIARDFLNGLLDLALLALPFAARQTIELRRVALGSDVFLNAIELIGRNIELIRPLVADMQKIAVSPLARKADSTHVLTNAVILMNHIITDAQISKCADLPRRWGRACGSSDD